MPSNFQVLTRGTFGIFKISKKHMKENPLNNLWFQYRLYLADGGMENIAQFLIWLQKKDFVDKKDFHFMG